MYRVLRLIAAAFALVYAASSYGLADAAAPTKIQIPFANGAGGAYVRTIPVASQIGIQNGAASYTDGFPPLNFTPISAGGVPPFGQDVNGILRDVSAHARWWAAGGPVYYDGTYQTAIGGYPKGACVQSAVTTARIWCSTAENNTTNPDTGGAGWQFLNDAVNAANLSSASGTIANGVTATTQASTDSSSKVATTAFVQSATLGNGQTLQNLFGSRSLNTPYTNNTGRPIVVYAVVSIAGASVTSCAETAYVLPNTVAAEIVSLSTATLNLPLSWIVPNGASYQITTSGTCTASSITQWSELR